MNEDPFCPPGYNGGFCADYDMNCEKCWEGYKDNEMKREEADLFSKIFELIGKGYTVSFNNGGRFGYQILKIQLLKNSLNKAINRATSQEYFINYTVDPEQAVCEILDEMRKKLEEENESKR